MTNGRVARLHRVMTERMRVQEETVEALRDQVAEAVNEALRAQTDLREALERLERIEAAAAPKGYRGRSRV